MKKCPYCDFNSHRAGDNAPFARYVDALLADIESERERANQRTIESVFIGGGTPSLFAASDIATILDAVADKLGLASDAEITMEANPGTVERGDPVGYLRAGVNRLSLGAQSFSATSLRALGRIHGPEEIIAAYSAAHDAGFENINIDLMFGLPGQNLAMANYDIEQAVALSPTHISYYQLTLEPNTVFYSRPPAGLPDDDLCWSIQEMGLRLLSAAGYQQYEISAFAAEGYRCRHNLNYWQFGDYLAIGAGSHGKFTDLDGNIFRYQKSAHPLSYLEQAESGNIEAPPQAITPADVGFEFMLNALRLPQGFSERTFSERTAQPMTRVEPALRRALDDKLMSVDQIGHWRPTGLGLRFLNDLQGRFLPARPPQ